MFRFPAEGLRLPARGSAAPRSLWPADRARLESSLAKQRSGADTERVCEDDQHRCGGVRVASLEVLNRARFEPRELGKLLLRQTTPQAESSHVRGDRSQGEGDSLVAHPSELARAPPSETRSELCLPLTAAL